MATTLLSFVTSLSAHAGFDIQFVHNETISGYSIIINDDYGKEVRIPISEKEMMILNENPMITDSKGKQRRYLDVFVENIKSHASKTFF